MATAMRFHILTAILILTTLTVSGRSISDIEDDGCWYRLYDEQGKQYKTASVSQMGELTGYSDNLVIFRKNGFYYIYDSNLKRQGMISVSAAGEIISVSGETFTTRKGNFIMTYDHTGKRLRSRNRK